jgi:hypothetical protein
MSQSHAAGEAGSPAKRHPVRFGLTMAVAYIAAAVLAGLDALWVIQMLIWLVIALIGVRVFSGRLGQLWPLVAGCTMAGVFGRGGFLQRFESGGGDRWEVRRECPRGCGIAAPSGRGRRGVTVRPPA